jgi:hypothetical protein
MGRGSYSLARGSVRISTAAARSPILIAMAHGRLARFAAAGVAGIALVGVLGVLHALGAAPGAFDLDEEYTVPAFYSGVLLALAALNAYRLATRNDGVDRTLLLLTSALLAFLALDEVFSFHERLGDRTGINWQFLYVPLGVAFATTIWRITGSLGRRAPEARMIFVALVAWTVAQLLEALAYSPLSLSLIDVDHMSQAHIDAIRHSLRYNAIAIPEELLEMGGSLLFAVAFGGVLSRQASAVTKMARRDGRRREAAAD